MFSLKAQTTRTFFVKNIEIIGNKKTKDNIIIREMAFRVGDTLNNLEYSIDQSRRQLLNLFLFNEVEIKAEDSIVLVKVTERWYIWPYPKLTYADRNINQWLLTKDPKRLIYGTDIEWYNFRGRNETIKLNLRMGYTRLANLNYMMPYINKKQSWGLNFIVNYSDNKEVWYKTDSNKVKFFKDNNTHLINRKGIEVAAIHRKAIFNYHRFYAGHKQISVADTVAKREVNANYLLNQAVNQKETYFGYSFTFDRRDFKGYPLRGLMVKLNVENSVYFGQSLVSQTVKGSVSKYVKLDKNIYNASFLGFKWMQFNKNAPIPYNKITALGYDRDYIRGYELYVIDGAHFGLAKTEFKYRIFERKTKFVSQLRNYEKANVAVFVTAFADAGYVWNNNQTNLLLNSNTMPNSLQYGYGAGLNAVMFYDYLLRIEFAQNKLNDHRFYLSFITAI